MGLDGLLGVTVPTPVPGLGLVAPTTLVPTVDDGFLPSDPVFPGSSMDSGKLAVDPGLANPGTVSGFLMKAPDPATSVCWTDGNWLVALRISELDAEPGLPIADPG